jgi:hypothetical protein
MTDSSATHRSLDALGIRAQATAVGLVQLTIELRQAGVIDEGAVDRIKAAMADELAYNRPRKMLKSHFDADVRARLDRIFAGEQPVGPLPAEFTDEPPTD